MEPFKLYYPLKPFIVTQKFGEVAHLQWYLDHGIQFKGHNGLDLIAKRGQPIYAAHDGKCFPEIDSSSGNGVVLRTLKEFNYPGLGNVYLKTIYWHLLPNIPVTTGQIVKAGQIIGYANSTGLSTGDHLHFGLKPVEQGESDGAWYNTLNDNGYNGAVDPMPFFNDEFAQDIGVVLKPYFSVNLQRGDTGPEVKKLQQFMCNLGYLTQAEVIGIYGPRTQNAVFQFQLFFMHDLTDEERYTYQGKYFGPRTRKVANTLI